MVTKIGHSITELHPFRLGRTTSYELKGRHQSQSQKHHCTLAPGCSFLSIHCWSETRFRLQVPWFWPHRLMELWKGQPMKLQTRYFHLKVKAVEDLKNCWSTQDLSQSIHITMHLGNDNDVHGKWHTNSWSKTISFLLTVRSGYIAFILTQSFWHNSLLLVEIGKGEGRHVNHWDRWQHAVLTLALGIFGYCAVALEEIWTL